MMTKPDILERLQIDPGQCTLGQLLQDREAALYEIRRLRAELERRSVPLTADTLEREVRKTEPESPRAILIRLTELCELLSVSRSTIYNWVSKGTFPAPVRIGDRAVRWRMDDVEAWQRKLRGSARPTARTI